MTERRNMTAAAAVSYPSDSTDTLSSLPGTPRSFSASVTRIAVLTDIAARYGDLVDTLNGPDGVRGDGGNVLRMPTTYSATVREFERLVVRLRDENRNLWWHLDGWWLSATTRTMHWCPRCGATHQSEHIHAKKNGHGLVAVKCKPIVIYRRRAGAREGIAGKAIEWIAGQWGLGTEPMRPGCSPKQGIHEPDCRCKEKRGQ